jgi:hypothetical protein
VETACGAALSLCYTQVIRDILPSLTETSDIVAIATGGSDIFLDDLDAFRRKYTNPPIVVKSGSEVFLKLGNSLSSIADLDTAEAAAASVGTVVLDNIRNDRDPGALDGFTRVVNSAKHFADNERNRNDLLNQNDKQITSLDSQPTPSNSDLMAALVSSIKQEKAASP